MKKWILEEAHLNPGQKYPGDELFGTEHGSDKGFEQLNTQTSILLNVLFDFRQ